MTFDEFLKAACDGYELDWRKYRRHASRRHLDERLRQLEMAGYEQYLERLQGDPTEAALLPDLLRVTVSRFFREREHWDFLRDTVVPKLLAARGGEPLRAWCAGCCNGEEPFSLALTLTLLSQTGPIVAADAKIIATDIDSTVLARAKVGVYGKSSLREVPPELLDRFFTRKGNEYRIDDSVREMVSFRQHNIRIDEPPPEIDLLLCRYLVFTYFTGERRLRTAASLYRALVPGGVLMVGRKDRLGLRELELFEPLPGSGTFFRSAH